MNQSLDCVAKIFCRNSRGAIFQPYGSSKGASISAPFRAAWFLGVTVFHPIPNRLHFFMLEILNKPREEI